MAEISSVDMDVRITEVQKQAERPENRKGPEPEAENKEPEQDFIDELGTYINTII